MQVITPVIAKPKLTPTPNVPWTPSLAPPRQPITLTPRVDVQLQRSAASSQPIAAAPARRHERGT
eukprot:5831489-Prorocentrum_lima.AAC.1